MAYCKTKGIEFLSTPFDIESVDLLAKLGLKKLKVPSGEITNAPFLLKIAKYGMPIILSTGNSTLGDIEDALGVLAFGYLNLTEQPGVANFKRAYASHEGQNVLRKNVSLLHCTSEYPSHYEDTNLKAMDTIAHAFGLPVGLSDHTPGISIPLAAVARGATIIEKHFTLDKTLAGPDHKASLSPEELIAMTKGIREIEMALGNGHKIARPSEIKNRDIARKSLVADKDIKKGAPFTEQNLTTKRPGDGVSPFLYWDYLGKSADRDFAEDEIIRSTWTK